jgi:hypothetical protein
MPTGEAPYSFCYRPLIVRKSRLIRLVVNLCVIGTLLFPGGGIRAASGAACDAAVNSTAKCPGCGHCSTSTSGECCGCCCKKRIARVAKVKPAERKACCKRSSVSSPSEQTAPTEHWGVCLCGHESQPAAPVPQNRSAPERLVRMLLTSPAIDIVATTDGTPGSYAEQAFGPPSLLPRDSQRRLCIWLI